VIKENMINELGGMDDGHPRFGDVKFSDLSRDEILRMGSSEYSEHTFEDEDEYYGTFDDTHKVNRKDMVGNFDYEDYDEDEFSDFDSYRKSKYGKDPKNKWDFNAPDEEMSRKYFKTYQEKSGGKPFKVRKRR
jgi:hypothetical protein